MSLTSSTILPIVFLARSLSPIFFLSVIDSALGSEASCTLVNESIELTFTEELGLTLFNGIWFGSEAGLVTWPVVTELASLFSLNTLGPNLEANGVQVPQFILMVGLFFSGFLLMSAK